MCCSDEHQPVIGVRGVESSFFFFFVRNIVFLKTRWFTARCQGGIDDVVQEMEEINNDGPGGGTGPRS